MDKHGPRDNKTLGDSTMNDSSNLTRKKNDLKAFVHPKRGDSQKWPSLESQPISDSKDNEDVDSSDLRLNTPKEEAKSDNMMPIPEEDPERGMTSKRSSVVAPSKTLEKAKGNLVEQKSEKITPFEAFRIIIGITYILMFIAILAVEENVYQSEGATLVIQVIELLFLAIIALDRIVDLLVKNKNPLSLYYSGLLIPVIFVLTIWTILDMTDKQEFRELGAYRFCRVILIVIKFDESKFILQYYFGNYIPQIHSNMANSVPGIYGFCSE